MSNTDRSLLEPTGQIKPVILWPTQNVAWPPGSGSRWSIDGTSKIFILSADK